MRPPVAGVPGPAGRKRAAVSVMGQRTRASIPVRSVLTESVYEAVKRLIMDLELRPGARINMEQLARDLEVSNTPLREALTRLEAEDLVTRRNLHGYTVAPLPDRADLEELFDLRSLLEPQATRRAVHRMTNEEIQLLENTIEGTLHPEVSEQVGDQYGRYRSLITADAVFHDLIAAASGNRLLRRTLAGLHGHLQLYRVYFKAGQAPRGLETTDEHQAIIAAIVARKPREAEAAMRHHLVLSRQRVVDTYLLVGD